MILPSRTRRRRRTLAFGERVGDGGVTRPAE
jgi:hypothetical protein